MSVLDSFKLKVTLTFSVDSPIVAVSGNVTTISVLEEETTLASTLPKVTTAFESEIGNPVPVIVISIPP